MKQHVVERPPVLLISPSITGMPGGITRYAQQILVSKTFSEAGFDIELVESTTQGGRIRKALMAAGAAFRVSVTRKRPCIAHALIASDASCLRKLALLMEARLLGIRTIAHFHGSTLVEWMSDLVAPVRRTLVRMMNHCDRVVTLGPRLAHYLESQGVITSIVVLPNGVPVLDRRVERPTRKYLLTAGLLGRRKGTPDLLEAFAQVSGRFQDVTLVLAGNGALEEARRQVAELELSSKVEITGWLDTPALHDLIRGAYAYVLPSYNEGMALSLLEAMMMGIPVIATPVGEQQTLIEDGLTGLLVTPGNREQLSHAMSRLLLDQSLAGRLGQNGRNRVMSGFQLSSNHEALLAIYRSLVAT